MNDKIRIIEYEVPEWAETARISLESKVDDDVHVYVEPNEPNEDFYDDGFVHARRDGVRFSTWFGETASNARIESYERKWTKLVNSVVAK